MQLIREVAGRYVVDDDRFVHVEGDVELPEGSPVIVTLARWQRERDALVGRAPLGIRLPSDARVESIAADLERFAVIAIEFPKFVDGRGYSIARRLREQHHYRGELRAVGNVLHDQLLAMARCGFTAFELDPSKRAESALAAFDQQHVFYQPAADEKLPLWKRHARAWPSKIES